MLALIASTELRVDMLLGLRFPTLRTHDDKATRYRYRR